MADPTAPSSPAVEAESERVFGLLLFEAEECLARGNVEKAAVHASRAVKERPESLTARSLLDRARRELTRGRRRERLEQRVAEARAQLARGEDQAAERIVATVLKLLPDHADALQLFSVLKDRRLKSSGAAEAEAEAELELEAMARSRARRAAEFARAALNKGWYFRALMTVRRALVITPDDPDLLALYTESLRLVDRTAGQRAVRRAAHVRILEARERMAAGVRAEAARILRAVLEEDPQNREALEALGTLEPDRRPAARASAKDPEVLTGKFSHRQLAGAGGTPAVAAKPGKRRRPIAPIVIGGGAALLLVAVSLALMREAPAESVVPVPVATSTTSSGTEVAARAAEETERAFTGQDPELRRAVEDVLARYRRALETADGGLLAQARPDLSAPARRDLLAEREGATSIASDLRVLEVARRGSQAAVTVRRMEVVVAGRSVARPSVEETLRFQREGGAWVLRPSR